MDDGDVVSFEVSSRNWASSESVRVVGRDIFRFRRRVNSRSSCLRFAGTVSGESERIVLACLRRELRVSLGFEEVVVSGASGALPSSFGGGSEDSWSLGGLEV